MTNLYSHFRRLRGFTLIELLIVVAIIAILAAIAVPNFLEAQTRAKVARAKADMRTITTGLETYHIDINTYPRNNIESWAVSFGVSTGQMLPTLERLTSPVAYLTGGSTFTDPFLGKAQYGGSNLGQEESLPDVKARYGLDESATPEKVYRYIARGPINTVIWNQPGETQKVTWYLLESAGPDAHYHTMGLALNSNDTPGRRTQLAKALYDATNGTISRGSIWRGGGGIGRGSFYKDMVQATY